MLDVVENQQQLPGSKMVAECFDHGPRRLLLDLQRLGYGLRHQTRIRQRGKLHQPDAVGKRLNQPIRDFDGKARLARAAGTGERHQPIHRHELLELRDLLLAPDEARQLIGQVVSAC